MEWLAQFHFIRPFWWFLLIPLAGFFIYLIKHKAQHINAWSKICDAPLLNALLQKTDQKPRHRMLNYLALFWLISVFALAGPSWHQQAQPVYQNNGALVIALDLAESMLAMDLQPSRLERARFKIIDILRKRREGLTGLVVFTSEPFTVIPLTSDTNTIVNVMPTLSPNIMPVLGNNAALALIHSGELIQQAGLSQGAILLISDNAGGPKAQVAAKQLRQQGIRILVLGVGTEQGAPIPLPSGGFAKDASGSMRLSRLENAQLEALAKAGGGVYQQLVTMNDSDITALLTAVDQPNAASEKTGNSSLLWKDQGVWVVWLLLPLWLLILLRVRQ